MSRFGDAPMSVPVVRMTLEGMQHTITHAFLQHSMEMDTDVLKAVREFCTPERIERMIAEKVATHIEQAIEREVRDFYSYGAGRDVIKAAVIKHLENNNA